LIRLVTVGVPKAEIVRGRSPAEYVWAIESDPARESIPNPTANGRRVIMTNAFSNQEKHFFKQEEGN
jgi:hypothetical protein